MKCPDCNGHAFCSSPPAGDGVCSSCGGTGKGILSGLNESFFKTGLPCRACGGTGVCQTCRGSGTVADSKLERYKEPRARRPQKERRHHQKSSNSSGYSGSVGGDLPVFAWIVIGIGATIPALVIFMLLFDLLGQRGAAWAEHMASSAVGSIWIGVILLSICSAIKKRINASKNIWWIPWILIFLILALSFCS